MDAASSRKVSKLDTSLQTRTAGRQADDPAGGRRRRRRDERPEERPGELHPALLGGHLQRQRNRVLPAGAHAQPQPPAGHSQSGGGFPEGAEPPAYLQRISAFWQAFRSYTSCIFFTWLRGRGSWRTEGPRLAQDARRTPGGRPEDLTSCRSTDRNSTTW